MLAADSVFFWLLAASQKPVRTITLHFLYSSVLAADCVFSWLPAASQNPVRTNTLHFLFSSVLAADCVFSWLPSASQNLYAPLLYIFSTFRCWQQIVCSPGCQRPAKTILKYHLHSWPYFSAIPPPPLQPPSNPPHPYILIL
jgi:hypothetical protein